MIQILSWLEKIDRMLNFEIKMDSVISLNIFTHYYICLHSSTTKIYNFLQTVIGITLFNSKISVWNIMIQTFRNIRNAIESLNYLQKYCSTNMFPSNDCSVVFMVEYCSLNPNLSIGICFFSSIINFNVLIQHGWGYF